MDDSQKTGVKGRVRVVIPTHRTAKLRQNSEQAPPKIDMVERTIFSLWEHVSTVFDDSVPITIVYNAHIPTADHLRTDIYFNNLDQYCKSERRLTNHPIDLMADLSPGYKGVRCAMPRWVKEDYIFVLEHDWDFVKDINLEMIIETMDLHSHINYVRFNKRKNKSFIKNMASGRPGGDIAVAQDDQIDFPLCITQQYSNNPHIERVSKLREWAQLAAQSTIFEGKNGGAGGFEHPLQEASYDDYQTMGLIGHAQKWGLYLYGAHGTGPYVQHFGI